ncbi:MAG: hypothetical protein PHU06_04065 [Gallionella sp.]|nr:hypothetical protein [Gallionella sp.]MDD4958687.1 hypothetical protein [Gallionella sp.]
MIGTMQFQYDWKQDVVIATPNWKIESREDCDVWFKQYMDFLTPFCRKVDVIFVLDNFVVASNIINVWAEYRINLLRNYVRLPYRVHSNRLLNLLLANSSRESNVISQDADSVEEAIAGITASRLEKGLQSVGTNAEVGTIQFQYDAENDVVIAIPNWKIETPADCEVWLKQYTDYLTPFGRKMDLVMVLDDFAVTSQIINVWGEYRMTLVKEHIRFSYRVHVNSLIKIIIKSGAFKYNAASQDADSIEGAIAGIKAARLEAGIR